MKKKFLKFSHLNPRGNLQMVDVSDKKSTLRFAKASALISLSNSTLKALLSPHLNPLPQGERASESALGAERSGVKRSEGEGGRDVLKKGDVFTTAKISGILAAKRVQELIPLTHPVPITHCDITFQYLQSAKRKAQSVKPYALCPMPYALKITAIARTKAETGVEMEALTAVTVAALTIYDMVKSVERGAVIEKIQLEEKWGGKSGHFRRSDKVVR